jgi:two-component system LytT family response regulator
MLKALIVDDEERARKRLRRLLEKHASSIAVAAEASGGKEALTLLGQSEIDIVFLDVQMPDLDGFEVLAALPEPPRYVIFTTAYDGYALDAFEVGAVDYLLKPFGERELERAVSRALERSAEDRFKAGYQQLLTALDRPRHIESIPVRYMGDIVLLPLKNVSCFKADNELVAIHCSGREYTTDTTLSELEKKLDPQRFFRIHRATIINLELLLRLEPIDGGRYIAVLADGQSAEVSRQAARRLRTHLGF